MSAITRIIAAAVQITSPDYRSFLPEGKEMLHSQLLNGFAYNNWQQLDPGQKELCCQALSNYYCDQFGIPNIPLHQETKGPGQYGGYYPGRNEIGLNSNLFTNGTTRSSRPYNVVDDSNWQLHDTVAHETRHGFQKWALDHPEEYLARCEDKEEGLQNLRGWALNTGRYYDDSDDPRYLAQPQEMDAWTFGHEETEKAFEEIEQRNGEEPEYVKDNYEDFWHLNDPEKAMEDSLKKDPNFEKDMESQMMAACDWRGIKYDYSDLLDQEELDSQKEQQADQEEELEFLDLGDGEDKNRQESDREELSEEKEQETENDETVADEESLEQPEEDTEEKEEVSEEETETEEEKTEDSEEDLDEKEEEEKTDSESLEETKEDPEEAEDLDSSEEDTDSLENDSEDEEDLDEEEEDSEEDYEPEEDSEDISQGEDESEDLTDEEESEETEVLDSSEDDLDSLENDSDEEEDMDASEDVEDSEEDLDNQDMDDSQEQDDESEESEAEESDDLDDTAEQSSEPEESSGESSENTSENTDDNDDENTY